MLPWPHRSGFNVAGLALLCVSLVLNGGCSFALVRPSPAKDGDSGTLKCRTPVAPALDAVAAIGLGVGAAYVTARGNALSDCSRNPNDFGCKPELGLWVPAAIFAASTVYGYWANSRCNGALEQGQDQPKGP